MPLFLVASRGESVAKFDQFPHLGPVRWAGTVPLCAPSSSPPTANETVKSGPLPQAVESALPGLFIALVSACIWAQKAREDQFLGTQEQIPKSCSVSCGGHQNSETSSAGFVVHSLVAESNGVSISLF